jgi:hypothetical protein
MLKRNTGFTHIQVILLAEYKSINDDHMTNACGISCESHKCMSRPKVQILYRNFGMLKNYKYKFSDGANF